MTRLMDAVVAVLRAYDAAIRDLNLEERKVLRSILACRIAKDIVDEELDRDLEEENAA